MLGFNRRTFVQLSAAEAALVGLGVPAGAQTRDAIAIAFPIDVPSWDPHVEMTPTPQSLYRCIFEGPLTQAPDLSIRPSLALYARYRDSAQLELEVKLRDDAYFHNGDRVTATDVRYSFFERPKAPVAQGRPRLPYSFIWRKVTDVEVVSPTVAVFHFSAPMPTAVPWLAFLSSYVIPKSYVERVGIDAFAKAPIGSGPYRVARYEPGSRIVLEAFDKHWGRKPSIKHVTIEIVKDSSARVAALESRRVDMATNLPYRDAVRIGSEPGMTSNIFSTADFLFVAPTLKGAFAKTEVRLAAHHAIDKVALSRAFFRRESHADHPTGGAPDARVHRGLSLPVRSGASGGAPQVGRVRSGQPGEHRLRGRDRRFPERRGAGASDCGDVEEGRDQRHRRRHHGGEVLRLDAREPVARSNAHAVVQLDR